MSIKRKYLFSLAALIWGVPGVIITIKGISAYCIVPTTDLWWLLAITFAGLCAFYFIFRKIVTAYSNRIDALPAKTSLWQTFPIRGWLLILFMMCLGIVLKHSPSIPEQFTASFYSGLGPMLIWSAIKFQRKIS
jgi:hypothetical protein